MGTLRLNLLGATGVVALIVGLASSPALANRRVIVLDVEGPRTGGLEKSLRGIVAERNELVSPRTYRVTARKLRAKSRSARHVARVATRLDADAVVDSELERHRRGYMLRIRVRDGDDGRIIKKLAVSLSNRRLSPRLQRKLAGKIDEAIVKAARGANGTKKIATKQRVKKVAKKERQPRKVARKPAPPKKVAKKEPRAKKVAKKSAPPKKPKSIDDEPFDMEESFDDSGNVIDDEVPAALR